MDVWGHSIYWTVLYLYRYIPQNMNTPVFFTMGSTVLVPVYLYISPYITYVLYYTLHCVRTGVCGVLLCVLLCGHANTRVVTRTQCMEYFLVLIISAGAEYKYTFRNNLYIRRVMTLPLFLISVFVFVYFVYIGSVTPQMARPHKWPTFWISTYNVIF